MRSGGTYIVGTEIELDVAFSDADCIPKDPTTVSAEIRLPDETIIDLTSLVTRSGVGRYAAPFVPTMNGLHQYRFSGAGALIVATESFFTAQSVF